jgi:hypothetical protein
VVQHLVLMSFGLLCMGVGFWGGYVLRQPYATLVAWCTPLGLVMAVLGTILLIIPNFFG